MPHHNKKGQSYDYAMHLGCQACFSLPLLQMTLRCDVIGMAPHGATGHGGVRAARALGLCLLVCLLVCWAQGGFSFATVAGDCALTKIYYSTQSQGDASGGPLTRARAKCGGFSLRDLVAVPARRYPPYPPSRCAACVTHVARWVPHPLGVPHKQQQASFIVCFIIYINRKGRHVDVSAMLR